MDFKIASEQKSRSSQTKTSGSKTTPFITSALKSLRRAALHYFLQNERFVRQTTDFNAIITHINKKSIGRQTVRGVAWQETIDICFENEQIEIFDEIEIEFVTKEFILLTSDT